MNFSMSNLLPPGTIIETKTGGNSTVHKYLLNSGEEFAVKIYGDHVSKQDKLREAWVYQNWIDKGQICNFISISADRKMLVTEWYKDRTNRSNTLKMEAILSFIESGIALHKRIGEHCFFYAKDMIRGLSDLVEQIYSRLSLLENQVDPRFELAHLMKSIHELSVEFLVHGRDIEIPSIGLLPSQSDIGFHNVLIGPNEFKIIDFEYFGLDNPYKLVGDFLLHPKNSIDVALMDTFMDYSKTTLKIQERALKSLIPFLALVAGLCFNFIFNMPGMTNSPGPCFFMCAVIMCCKHSIVC